MVVARGRLQPGVMEGNAFARIEVQAGQLKRAQ
jgi:hypothetical protein